jgi:Zn-dependent M28 family amino/carboxypeptidase
MIVKFRIVFLLIVSTLIVVSCNNSVQKTNNSKTKKKAVVIPPKFNADSAYKFIEEQVNFGPRVPGTESYEECADWISDKLRSYGAQVEIQKFKARTYDKVTRNGKNIIASFNPKEQKRVLLMAHWDTRPFADHDHNPDNKNKAIDGANDGGSGVGVLLEMARQFSMKAPGVGVDIVLFDLEDWGPPSDLQIPYDEEYWGLGSQYWAQNPHKYGYNPSYGILLDMVGAKNAEFRREYYSDRYAEFVVNIVWDAADTMGYGNLFINEQGGQITDDHYFVNKYARIPSIDIIHLDPTSVNRSFFDQWHTVDDNMDIIDKTTLKGVGEVMMYVVYNE